MVIYESCLLYFFFFQAEDGIRDLYVTGVQTCALPILKMSQNRCFHLIPLFSSNSALFCAMERPQLLFHQSLPHSFPCNGGGVYLLPIRSLLGTRPAPP